MNLNRNSFWQIIDNLNDGIYIVDRQRHIIYWNDAAEHISGFKAGEVVGSSCADNILCHVDECLACSYVHLYGNREISCSTVGRRIYRRPASGRRGAEADDVWVCEVRLLHSVR